MKRRHFLRCSAGGLGTLLSLPALESLYPSEKAFAAEASLPRLWMTYQPNGYAREKFYPTQVKGARDFSLLGCSLEPLEARKNQITIFKHLENRSMNSPGNSHLVSLASYLTGSAIKNDDGDGHRQSVHYHISAHYEKTAQSRVRQLVLCANDEVDPKKQSYNNRYKNNLSFDDAGRFVTPTNDLKKVFEQLFAGFDPGMNNQAQKERETLRKSVLDHVLSDAKDLEKRLGTRDRRVMDQYFTNLREVETRLTLQPVPGASCSPGMNNFQSYPLGPQGRVDRVGDHWLETARLLALAFQCEATRVCSYLLGGEAAGSRYADAGINQHIHNSLSHSSGGTNRQLYAKLDQFHAQIIAKVLKIFEETPSGTGNLLDHTVIHLGTGMGDGNPHEKNFLYALLMGNTAKWKHGHLVNVDNKKSNAVLMNTIVQGMGIPNTDGFGEANGAQDVFYLS